MFLGNGHMFLAFLSTEFEYGIHIPLITSQFFNCKTNQLHECYARIPTTYTRQNLLRMQKCIEIVLFNREILQRIYLVFAFQPIFQSDHNSFFRLWWAWSVAEDVHPTQYFLNLYFTQATTESFALVDLCCLNDLEINNYTTENFFDEQNRTTKNKHQ